jgi:hypothetical protein
VGYDLLLRESDPDLVNFEVDCGWMIFAGRNPIDYLKVVAARQPELLSDYPGRAALLLSI